MFQEFDKINSKLEFMQVWIYFFVKKFDFFRNSFKPSIILGLRALKSWNRDILKSPCSMFQEFEYKKNGLVIENQSILVL